MPHAADQVTPLRLPAVAREGCWSVSCPCKALRRRPHPLAGERADGKGMHGSLPNGPDQSYRTGDGVRPKGLVLDGLRNWAR